VNVFARGFRWAVVVGILQDWFFAFAGVFVPQAVLELVGADPVPQHVWPAYASLLLVFLSLFYIPAAIDPYRYGSFAVLAVLARVGGVFFFFVLYPGAFPPLLGYIDAVFTLVQATLLVLAFGTAGPPTPRP
jgi:hypothetical protein